MWLVPFQNFEYTLRTTGDKDSYLLFKAKSFSPTKYTASGSWRIVMSLQLARTQLTLLPNPSHWIRSNPTGLISTIVQLHS